MENWKTTQVSPELTQVDRNLRNSGFNSLSLESPRTSDHEYEEFANYMRRFWGEKRDHFESVRAGLVILLRGRPMQGFVVR